MKRDDSADDAVSDGVVDLAPIWFRPLDAEGNVQSCNRVRDGKKRYFSRSQNPPMGSLDEHPRPSPKRKRPRSPHSDEV